MIFDIIAGLYIFKWLGGCEQGSKVKYRPISWKEDLVMTILAIAILFSPIIVYASYRFVDQAHTKFVLYQIDREGKKQDAIVDKYKKLAQQTSEKEFNGPYGCWVITHQNDEHIYFGARGNYHARFVLRGDIYDKEEEGNSIDFSTYCLDFAKSLPPETKAKFAGLFGINY
ncbi:MAG: hypothetical protein NT116_05615 [Candidatus Parcubacteria bacterium]|nr:hypothetical protein [Candidatus Parcubacteria bacterium]